MSSKAHFTIVSKSDIHTSLSFQLKYFLSFKLQHIRPVWCECLTLWIKGLHCAHCTVHHAALLLATGWHLFTTCPPFRGIYPFFPSRIIHSYWILTSKTWFYKLPAARFNPKNLIFLIKRFENFQKKPSKIFKNVQKMSK